MESKFRLMFRLLVSGYGNVFTGNKGSENGAVFERMAGTTVAIRGGLFRNNVAQSAGMLP